MRHCTRREIGTRFVVISGDSYGAGRSTGLPDRLNVEPEARKRANHESARRNFGLQQWMLARRRAVRPFDQLAVNVDDPAAPFGPVGGLAGLPKHFQTASVADRILRLDRAP
jgi:hypothetical protein